MRRPLKGTTTPSSATTNGVSIGNGVLRAYGTIYYGNPQKAVNDASGLSTGTLSDARLSGTTSKAWTFSGGTAPTAPTATQVKVGAGNVLAGGKIGVGLAVPGAPLHVVSTTNEAARFQIATANGALGACNLNLRNSNTTVGNASSIQFDNAASTPVAFVSAQNNNHNAAATASGSLLMSVIDNGTWRTPLWIGQNGYIGLNGVGAPQSALAMTLPTAATFTSFTGQGSSVAITNIPNDRFGKLTFGNATQGDYAGIGVQVTGSGSYFHIGTSNNFSNGCSPSVIHTAEAHRMG